jgi:hypothetical protein
MIPPPRPETMANEAKPIGSNRWRRATDPPRIAFANTPIRSSTASTAALPATPLNTRSSFLLPSLHCSVAGSVLGWDAPSLGESGASWTGQEVPLNIDDDDYASAQPPHPRRWQVPERK